MLDHAVLYLAESILKRVCGRRERLPGAAIVGVVSMSAARFRYTLVAGATAVVIGTGFTVVGLERHAQQAPSVRSAQAPLAADSSQDYPPAADPESPSPSATSSATPTPTPTGTPSARATSRAPVKPKPRRTTTAPPRAPRPPATGDAVLDAVLGHINGARARAGLPAYTLSTSLSKASALHTQRMIDGCGLQHQCSGESGIGDRFSAQGVRWTAAGENIGFGSSGSSQSAIIGTANGLTDSMLAEKPPNDGHRKNLLSGTFKRIGLSVVRAGDGRVWMTQDFVN
jgi:uncharacterized protein YkwD